jgi:lipoate-protein ligase A
MNLFPKLFLSTFDDPYINLSIENQLLLNIRPDERILFLYNNQESVVLGRFQNPWLECNLKKISERKINLVRRQSGGGCVYHDKGNLNFSFLYPEKEHSSNWIFYEI